MTVKPNDFAWGVPAEQVPGQEPLPIDLFTEAAALALAPEAQSSIEVTASEGAWGLAAPWSGPGVRGSVHINLYPEARFTRAEAEKAAAALAHGMRGVPSAVGTPFVKQYDGAQVTTTAQEFLADPSAWGKKSASLTATAGAVFSRSEQDEIINEGEGARASNLAALDLTGTHYVQDDMTHYNDDDDTITW